MNKVMLPLFLWGIGLAGEAGEFSHFQHVKTEELQCSDCHSKTMRSSSFDDHAGVADKTCMKCHSDDSAFKVVRPLVMADPSFLIGKRAEKGDLKFSHQAHATAKVACAQCHGEVLAKGAVAEPGLLGMRDCMECHVKKAEVSCLTCHDKVAKPLDHLSAAWLRSEGHGLEANLDPKDCAMCHEHAAGEAGDCAECHMGSDARKVHGANFRFNHGVDVKFKKMDCASCHQPLEQFCGDCHEGKGRATR